MRRAAPLTLVLVLLSTHLAQAETRLVEGHVLSSRARWSGYKNAIITESVVLTEDGREVEVWQGGGKVPGFGMWMSHSPPLLKVGDRVQLEASTPRLDALTRSSRQSLQITSVLKQESLVEDDFAGFASYVRTENPTGAGLFWPIRDFKIVYEANGVSTIPGTGEFTELDKAFAAWQTESATCGITDPKKPDGGAIELVRFDTTARDTIEVGNDGTNLVKFRELSWCRPIEDGMEMCYNPSAAGLTTLFFVNDEKSKRNGEVVDADIEFNGVNFIMWRDGDPVPMTGCAAETGNTATHEIGHFLGLDHSCWDGNPPRRTTSDGELVPRCSPMAALSMDVTEATMYNFQDCEETKKKTLEDGDVQFVCDVYPPRVASGDGGCCRVAEPKPGAATQALFGMALLLLAARQVLRRRSRRYPK